MLEPALEQRVARMETSSEELFCGLEISIDDVKGTFGTMMESLKQNMKKQ
jgi:hypothetical protein